MQLLLFNKFIQITSLANIVHQMVVSGVEIADFRFDNIYMSYCMLSLQ